eukprot:sb/3460689/
MSVLLSYYLEGYDQLSTTVKISGSDTEITELTDLNLQTVVTGITAGSTATVIIDLEGDDPYGIFKIMIYGKETSTDVSGWTATAKIASSPPGSQNTGDSVCGTESTGTDYFTFTCTMVTAATSIELGTSSAKADLAEVVVAGLLWTEFPVQPGTKSSTGKMSNSEAPEGCSTPDYQDMEGMTFCRSAKYLEGYDQLSTTVKISGSATEITELTDLNLQTVVTGITAGSTATVIIDLEGDDPYGIFKIMIYGKETSTDVSGWTATAKIASSPPGSQNTGDSVCGTESTGTDYFTFTCTMVTAATSIELGTSSAKADLAEVVVAGLLWTEFPVQPGTKSSTGKMSNSEAPTGCSTPDYQDMEGMTFCRSAKYKIVPGISDGKFDTFRQANSISITFESDGFELHDIVVYNINYDDFNGDQSSTSNNEQKVVTCAASQTDYEAANCVGMINGAQVKVTKYDGDTVENFGSAIISNTGKSRRSQTYRIKDTAVVIKKITFSQDFYLADINVYGAFVSSTDNHWTYQNTVNAKGVLTCEINKVSSSDLESCEDCPQGTNWKKAFGVNGDPAGSEVVSCPKCEAGQYSTGGSMQCTDCTSGSITNTEGQFECTKCEPGTVSRSSSDVLSTTECTPCPAGFIAGSEGLHECTECTDLLQYSNSDRTVCEFCPKGQERNTAKDGCDDCVKGKYRPDTTTDKQCMSCGPGKYTDAVGQFECKVCDDGYQPNSNKDGCDICPIGMKKNSTDTECESCPIGYHTAGQDGAAECTPCEAGFKGVEITAGGIDSKKAFECVACAKGEYNSEEGHDTCTPCSDTTVATETARPECRLCALGTVRVNSTHCEDCLPGQYNDNQTITRDSCPMCPYNHCSTEKNTHTCTKCGENEYAEIGKTECKNCTDFGELKTALQNNPTDVRVQKCGYQPNSNKDGCDICPIGMKKNSTDTECESCPIGYHTAGQEGAAECTPCEAGFKGVEITAGGIDSKKAFECVACAKGEYNSEEGHDTCTPCSDTTVATETARPECRLCALGTVRVNSTHCEDCLPGQYNDNQTITRDSCPMCPYNHFSTEKNTHTCTKCGENEYAEIGKTECKNCTDFGELKTALKNMPADVRVQKCVADKGAACEAVNITDTYGTYNLPFLFNNDFVTEDCVYDDPSEKRKAVFFCEIDPLDKTKAYYTSEYGCFKTANTEKYDELAKNAENEIANDPEKATADLATLTNSSGDGAGLADLEATTGFLDILTAPASEGSGNATVISTEATKNVINAVSNLAAGNMQSTDIAEAVAVCDKMVSSLKAIAKATESEGLVKSPNLAILKTPAATKTDDTSGAPKVSLSFNLGDLDDLTSMSLDDTGGESVEPKEPSVAIESGASSISVVILKDDNFFPTKVSVRLPKSDNKTALEEALWDSMTTSSNNSSNDTGNTEVSKSIIVNSIILEVDMGDSPAGTTLDLFIKPAFQVGGPNSSKSVIDGYRKVQIVYKCGVYVPKEGVWDMDSCQTVYDEMRVDAGVMCRCDHNTSFAVLMAAEEIDPGYLESQSIMSKAFLGASILGLFATIGLILPASAVAKSRSAKVNMCFSFTLLLASIMFLIQDFLVNAENTGLIKLQSVPCAVYTMIQHYLWLVVFMWTIIEGFLMYLSLVQVFGSHISKYMLKFNLAAWLIPLPLPIIGYFVFTKTHIVGGVEAIEHNYMADSMCFLKPKTIAFFALFFGPLVLAILVNLVFFALVLKVIRASKNANLSDRELFLVSTLYRAHKRLIRTSFPI